MLKLQSAPRPTSASRKSTRVVENLVERFLMESERRVIVHCQKLLEHQSLPIEEWRRLLRLIGEAEARLKSQSA